VADRPLVPDHKTSPISCRDNGPASNGSVRIRFALCRKFLGCWRKAGVAIERQQVQGGDSRDNNFHEGRWIGVRRRSRRSLRAILSHSTPPIADGPAVESPSGGALAAGPATRLKEKLT